MAHDFEHTKIRRGQIVVIVSCQKQYFVVEDNEGKFQGFYSGLFEESNLPNGWKFKSW